jgi:2-oxoisovalerate dehydrogenase E2 component (dihydrolipoyl transacylase)
LGQYVFKLPDVGEGTAEAEIVAWHVRVGETVAEDAPLVDVMTDKATVEMTSPVSGRVISLHGEPGAMAPVGAPIAVIETEAAETPGAANGEAKAEAASATSDKPRLKVPAGGMLSPEAYAAAEAELERKRAQSQSLTRPLAREPTASQKRAVQASPSVRQRASQLGVDLASVDGRGPQGRVTHQDLDRVLMSGQPRRGAGLAERNGIEPVKVIGLRRKIAEKMAEAKRRIPHITYVEECDVTAIEELRAHLNETRRAHQPKLTLLPFLMRALARALPEFPHINARFDDEAGVVYRHEAVDIGIATQTEDGLIVPVVRNVEARDIWECAAELARLSAAVRAGSAEKGELSGSTISITSLGALGGIVTTPIINHPEVAIVGVNKIVERPVVKSGQIVIRKIMNLSSSFDHRVVDGYDAALFIQRIRAMIEHPAALFMDH